MDQDNGGVVSRPRNRTTVCVGQFNITKESSGEKLDIRHSLRSVFLVPDTLVVRIYWGALSAKFVSPHLVVWSHGQKVCFLVQELVDPSASV